MFSGDLQQAIAHFEDGLAVLPATAVQARQRAVLLICLAVAAGLAGDEERVVACRQQLAALTEASGEFSRRWSSAWSLWALGVAAWRQADLDRATGLQQQSLRLWEGLNEQMGDAYCLEALAWIAASQRQHERAAVLLGAATGLLRSMGTTLDGYHHLAGFQRDCERQARQALGEAAFQAACHRGLDLPAEDAVAYALQQPPEKPRTGTGRIRWGAADVAGTAGGPPGRRGPQQQADRRRAGDRAADRRRPRGAHLGQARLHLPRPGRRLGRRVPTRRRPAVRAGIVVSGCHASGREAPGGRPVTTP